MEQLLQDILITINDTRTLIILCTIFVVADILSGYIKCFKLKNYKSSINRDGIAKKIMWYLLMLVGVCIELITHTNTISLVVTTTCCITEFMSVIENARDIGIEFTLTKFLENKE